MTTPQALAACTIVIDGANVACQKDGTPSMAKLAAAIAYFRAINKQANGARAIKCVAFAPNFWLNAKSSTPKENGTMDADDWTLLSALVEKDHVILTPSQAHDDFYVIDYAVKYDGFIVTNDMFRDHVSNKRTFHGKKLTSSWVKTHCIDFTFVGKEFLPNPRAMERVHSYAPRLPSPPSSSASPSPSTSSQMVSDAVAPQKAISKPSRSSSLSNGLSESLSDDDDDDDEADEHAMLVDQRAKLKRNIDLSEVTHYKVPRYLLPFLHGEGGDTMNRFQEYTGTYIVLPSLASVGATPSRPLPDVANLSIYGGESNRQQAVSTLDAFLSEMQQQHEEFQYYQQMQAQQQQQYHAYQQQHHHVQHHPHMHSVSHSNSVPPPPDDQMMDVDHF